MSQYLNSAEGGTNGTTVSTVNSGGGSGTAWDAVSIVTGGTLTFDNTHVAHGALAMVFATGATSGQAYVEKSFAAASGLWGLRFYLYRTANPASSLQVCEALTAANLACMGVQVTTTGKLSGFGSGTNLPGTTVNSMALNQWVRVELTYNVSTTTATLALFNAADSATATETLTSNTTTLSNGNAGKARFGILSPGASLPSFWVDDTAVDDAAATAFGPILGKSIVCNDRAMRRNSLIRR